MIALFNARPGDSLRDLRSIILCKKLSADKSFVTPQRLPPTAYATRFHSLRSYLQVMLWMGMSDDMEATELGWDCQGNSLIPVMMNTNPAPEALIKMIQCNCSTAHCTYKCSCKKKGLNCSHARYQDHNCDNIRDGAASDELVAFCLLPFYVLIV